MHKISFLYFSKLSRLAVYLSTGCLLIVGTVSSYVSRAQSIEDFDTKLSTVIECYESVKHLGKEFVGSNSHYVLFTARSVKENKPQLLLYRPSEEGSKPTLFSCPLTNKITVERELKIDEYFLKIDLPADSRTWFVNVGIVQDNQPESANNPLFLKSRITIERYDWGPKIYSSTRIKAQSEESESLFSDVTCKEDRTYFSLNALERINTALIERATFEQLFDLSRTENYEERTQSLIEELKTCGKISEQVKQLTDQKIRTLNIQLAAKKAIDESKNTNPNSHRAVTERAQKSVPKTSPTQKPPQKKSQIAQ